MPFRLKSCFFCVLVTGLQCGIRRRVRLRWQPSEHTAEAKTSPSPNSAGISNINPPDIGHMSDDSFHHTVLYLRLQQNDGFSPP
ncbi:hypothetical protein Chor_011568 [Crotalus horridus]